MATQTAVKYRSPDRMNNYGGDSGRKMDHHYKDSGVEQQRQMPMQSMLQPIYFIIHMVQGHYI